MIKTNPKAPASGENFGFSQSTPHYFLILLCHSGPSYTFISGSLRPETMTELQGHLNSVQKSPYVVEKTPKPTASARGGKRKTSKSRLSGRKLVLQESQNLPDPVNRSCSPVAGPSHVLEPAGLPGVETLLSDCPNLFVSMTLALTPFSWGISFFNNYFSGGYQ